MAAQSHDATEMIVAAETASSDPFELEYSNFFFHPHVLNINVNSRIKAFFFGSILFESVVVEVEPLNGFNIY